MAEVASEKMARDQSLVMGCAHVSGAIVCGPKIKRCGGCGQLASRQCDWKVASRSTGTCDAWICDHCTTEPAPGKDLCRIHALAWGERLCA